MATFLGREVMHRAMSVFNPNMAIPGWEAIALRAMQNLITPSPSPHTTSTTPSANTKQQLILTSWKLPPYQFHNRAVERSKFIIDHILDGHNLPDIICLQDVYSRVQEILIEDKRVRSQYLATDVVDALRFMREPVSPANMMLLSKKRFRSTLDTKKGDEEKLVVDNVFRVKLDTKVEEKQAKKEGKELQKRNAFCVDISSPSSRGITRIINVHLQSGNAAAKRNSQLELLNSLLRQPQVRGGVIAGDFNAHSPDEHSLVEKFKLLDACVALHGSKNGNAWGVGEQNASRSDKIVMLGAKPDEIEVLPAGPAKNGFMSIDHCGLRTTFTI